MSCFVRRCFITNSRLCLVIAGIWLCTLTACGTSSPINSKGGDADAVTGDATTDQDAIGGDVALGDAATPDAANQDAANDSDGGAQADGDAASSSDDYAELLIKILGPSGQEWAQNEGASASISGVAWGQPDKIAWSVAGGKAGVICGPSPATETCAAYRQDADNGDFWQSDILTLAQGDNAITVTATKGSQTVSDMIHITYNPLFSFDGPPTIAPNAVFVGDTATLVVGMSVPGAAGSNVVDAATIQLIEVDADGKLINPDGMLQDNGSATNCDDAQKDSIYSACLTLNPTAPKTYRFRVQATVSVVMSGTTVTKYQALSPVAEVDAVARFTSTECNAINGLQQSVSAAYKTSVAAGTSAATALATALAAVQADPSVAEAAATDGGNVWIRYKSGRLGALNLATKGLRGSGGPPSGDGAALPTHAVGTRRALSLAPASAEFTASGGDEAAQAATALSAKQCPPFAVDAYTDNAALLRYYRDMESYGIVAISGHGDSMFKTMDVSAKQALAWEHLGSQEVIWSGEAVDCTALSSSTGSCQKDSTGCKPTETCVKTSTDGGVCVDYTQADVMTGRAVIGDATYGLVPSFVRRHSPDKFPASIVYLGTCRSMYNGSMALQFIAAGAAAVIGYSDYVSESYAYEKGWGVFDALINGGLSASQGIVPGDDPAHPGARIRFYGDDAANANDANLVNPSWDTGTVTGWKPVGDGRVISRLGAAVPVAGKFMGIISTGLGFTTENGSLEQPFCVDKDKQQLCYWWKFYSEEFIEWCGSEFMDEFRATLTTDTGPATVMTDVWIDALCPYDCGGTCTNSGAECLSDAACAGGTCVGKDPCDPGSASCKCGQQWKTLTHADVSFDQGDVWMTPWQHTCSDVSALSGLDKKVNLKFFATDVGDSIYDTAILLDEVTVE